jgi:hypothetical protein
VSDSDSRGPTNLRLKAGVSLSQARFALSNFCLNHFGADGQFFADMLDLCVDVNQLQEVLRTIREEMRTHYPDRYAQLLSCVREANDGAETSTPSAVAGRPATPAAADPAKRNVRPTPPGNGPAVISKPVLPRTPPVQPSTGAEPDPLRLAAGISLVQARFVLSEFCLDQFGARGQPLVDAIDRCTDPSAMQRVLTMIGSEVSQRDALAKLVACVREINETGE